MTFTEDSRQEIVAAHARGIERLRAELGTVKRDLSTDVGKVREAVRDLDARVERVETLLDRIYTRQLLNESLAQARDERNRLLTQLDVEFAGRKEIRRLAVSLISAAGSAAVRDKVIDHDMVAEISGQHLLKDADYWLAAAVVAIAAEQLGHVHVGPAAWSLAATSDPARSELFLALFYSRLRQEDAAAMSMNRYLDALDPHALGREFSHVVNALAELELGVAARSYAQEAMRRWDAELSMTRGGVAAAYAVQFDTCRSHLLVHRDPLPAERFPTLRRYAAEHWETIEESWPYAAACRAAAAGFRARFPEAAVTADDRRVPGRSAHAQRALRALIDQPGPDEVELRREIRTQDLIIQCGGDRERAAELAGELGDPFADASDFPTLLTQAAFEPEAYGLGVEAQRLALACASHWITGAGESVTSEAAARRPGSIAVTWHAWTDTVEAAAPPAAEAERVGESLCGFIAWSMRPPRFGWWKAGSLLAGLAFVLLAFGRLAGYDRWLLAAIGVGLAGQPLMELATLRRKRRLQAVAIAEEQVRAREAVRLLVAESAELLRLWDHTAESGLRELEDFLCGLSAPRLSVG